MMNFIAFLKRSTKLKSLGWTAISVIFLSGCPMQQGASLLSAKTSDGDSVQKVLDKVPFAYDVAIDTISYNSCVGIDLNTSGKLHGLKLGANEGFVDTTATGAVKGGLKLKSEFLQYIAKNVDPVFPNTSISPSQIKFILQNSTANQSLRLQYAIRDTTILQVVQDVINADPSNPITVGRDGIYGGGFLSEDPIVTAITKSLQFGPNNTVLSEGPRVYNLGSKSSPEALEASLGYSFSQDASAPPVANADDGVGAGEEYSDIVRGKFNSLKVILAVTFGNDTLISSSDLTPSFGFNSPKRPSESDLKKAFGRGYELTFSSKNAAFSSWRKNLLTRVNEKSLEDGRVTPGATWTCESIVIMKPNQLNNKKIAEPACAELIGSDLVDTNIRAKVKMIRRHYTEDLWAIGFFYPANTVYVPATRLTNPTLCLVNKQTNCYLPTSGIITEVGKESEDIGIQYDPSKECYLSRANTMGVSYIGNLTGDAARRLGRCAQYASICIRSSTSF